MKPQEAHDVTMWHVFELVKRLNMDSYFLLKWWFWPEKIEKEGLSSDNDGPSSKSRGLSWFENDIEAM